MTEPLLTEVDHVAIAVRDLDAAIAFYEETFGATVVHRERVDSDGVEEALHQGGGQLHPAADPHQ
jgi:methylmalonyl-CoA/ethylmalonyl-CoA epimerase